VCVLEDIHAADEPSLHLLRFLARKIVNAHLLIVATYRNTAVTTESPLWRALGEIAPQSALRLTLTGLDRAEVARYIELATSTKPAADIAEAVYLRTDGKPVLFG
jgi:predicted ATPase